MRGGGSPVDPPLDVVLLRMKVGEHAGVGLVRVARAVRAVCDFEVEVVVIPLRTKVQNNKSLPLKIDENTLQLVSKSSIIHKYM